MRNLIWENIIWIFTYFRDIKAYKHIVKTQLREPQISIPIKLTHNIRSSSRLIVFTLYGIKQSNYNTRNTLCVLHIIYYKQELISRQTERDGRGCWNFRAIFQCKHIAKIVPGRTRTCLINILKIMNFCNIFKNGPFGALTLRFMDSEQHLIPRAR